MKKIAWWVSVVLLLSLAPRPASAAISVTLKLDRNEATPAEAIKMVVSVFGTRISGSTPLISGLEAFVVILESIPTQEKGNSVDADAGIDYTYLIHPKRAGTFQVGPAEVAIQGETFQSNTCTLTIVEEPRAPYFARDLLFLNSELSTGEVYVEEQVIYTLKLYRKARVSDIDLDLPDAEYLTIKQLGNQTEYAGVYGGQDYQILEVRYALIPYRAGVLGIQPARMTMNAYRPGEADRGTFDSPVYALTSGQRITLHSEPLALEVLPLPEKQRPAGFSGLVGSFHIDSQLTPPSIKVGESATLMVTLSGRGNVMRMPDLKPPELARTKVYLDQAILREEPDDKGLAASKITRWALVPEREGDYPIPPLSISFFDTETHQYRVLKTPSHSLSVLPGEKGSASEDGAEEGTDGAPLKHAVRELSHDILPVRGSVEDLATGVQVRPDGLAFWVVLLVPLFVYVGTFWHLRSRTKSDSAIAAMKAKRAARILTRQCRQTRLSSSDLTLSIRNYLNDRFGLSLGTLTPEEALDILESRGVHIETAAKLRNLLGGLEDAIYTGKGDEPCETEEDIPKLVKQIEKEIR